MALLAANDAAAKDVAGLLIMGFVLAGGLVGLVVGAMSVVLERVGFWRGAALMLVMSLLSWGALLLYWDFPFAGREWSRNLPFLLLVLMGSVPAYLVAYGIARIYIRD